MHTLLKALHWNIVIFAFWTIYNSALVVCQQVEVEFLSGRLGQILL